MKKTLAIIVLLTVCLALSGCFGMGGSPYGPEKTLPPQKEFKSFEELAQAVKAARESSDADETGLGLLTHCYRFKQLPEGASVNFIKVSKDVVRVAYAFGPVNENTYENQLELAWYRMANTADFLSGVAKSLPDYDTVTAGGIDYLHIVPTVEVIVTIPPGSTAAPTPTPNTVKFCQLVYWVQDNAAFMAAIPLGFTNDDIGTYCGAEEFPIE